MRGRARPINTNASTPALDADAICCPLRVAVSLLFAYEQDTNPETALTRKNVCVCVCFFLGGGLGILKQIVVHEG